MLRATETFHAVTKHGVRTVTPQDLIDERDEIVKGREGMFTTIEDGDKPARPRRGRPPAKKGEPTP